MLRLLGLCALLLLLTPSSIGQEADIVSFRMADTADPNERVMITVTVRNSAENTLDDNGQIVEDRGWRRSDGYGVGMVFTDGPSSTGEVFNHVERLTRDVPAGGTAQASWTVNVPRTPGEYLFTVTMVDDRNNAFGERVVENIEVEAAHVVGWRTRVQGRAQPEQEVTLNVTVENEGETNWPPGAYTVTGYWTPQEIEQSVDFVVVGQDREVIVVFPEPVAQASLTAATQGVAVMILNSPFTLQDRGVSIDHLSGNNGILDEADGHKIL